MTNEELAARIRAGETELMADLWEQCRKIIRLLAYRYYALRENHAFVEMADLMQCGYLALAEAVKYFDPERGAQFITFLKLTYKNEMHRLFNAKITREDGKAKWVFPYAPDSLDAPNNNCKSKEGTGLLERWEDDTDIQQEYEQKEIREIVMQALSHLESRERAVIWGRYYQEKTRKQLVDGVVYRDIWEVGKHENRAMKKLRKDQTLQDLYMAHFYDPRLPSPENHTPESVVIAHEDLTDWMQGLFTEMEA